MFDKGAVITGGLSVASLGLFVSGGITVIGTSISSVSTLWTIATSDRRLKTQVSPIGDALRKVSKLNGIYFKWIQNEPTGQKFDDKRHVGLVAQEVQQVLPEGVHFEDAYLKVDYTSLIPLLVEAMHELEALVRNYESDTMDSESVNGLWMLTQLKEDLSNLQQLLKVKDEEVKGIKNSLELKDSELQVLREWKKTSEERQRVTEERQKGAEERQKAAEERQKVADSRLDTLERMVLQMGG